MTAKQKSSNKNTTHALRRGESQRKNGTYDFRWTDTDGRRHTIYASTLTELRLKEQQVRKEQTEGLKPETRSLTVNDLYALWVQLKRGLKDNTFQNYVYLYDAFVKPTLGKKRLSTLVKSDVKRFYNTLADERGLSITTIDNVHTVLHQILDMAVDDSIIRTNPSSNMLKELKLTHVKPDKRRALSAVEEQRFLRFLLSSNQYRHWYPVFALMLGTGLRVGEAVGLRWCDVDFDANYIDVNHTLVYYRHAVNGCYPEVADQLHFSMCNSPHQIKDLSFGLNDLYIRGGRVNASLATMQAVSTKIRESSSATLPFQTILKPPGKAVAAFLGGIAVVR